MINKFQNINTVGPSIATTFLTTFSTLISVNYKFLALVIEPSARTALKKKINGFWIMEAFSVGHLAIRSNRLLPPLAGFKEYE
jgi:hypothetical protein